MQRIDDTIGFRAAVPSDLAYIYKTWLGDLRALDPSPLPSDIWYPAYRSLVDRVLAKREVDVTILSPLDNLNDILGYTVVHPAEALWWIHVRRKFRGKFGLAKLLLQKSAAENLPAAWRSPHLRNPVRSRSLRPLLTMEIASSGSTPEVPPPP